MRVSFSMMIGAGAVLSHLHIYLRLVRQLPIRSVWRHALAGLLAVMTLVLVSRSALRDLGGGIAQVYDVVSYSWIALAVCTVVAVAVGDLVRLGLGVQSWLTPARRVAPTPAIDDPGPEVDEARRTFITRTLPWSIVAGGGVLTGYGVFRAFTPPEVTELALPLAKLPKTLDGLTIVQLTDLHVGSFIGPRLIQQLVDQTNALKPDVIVITGDLVDGDVPRLGPTVARLAGLRARFGTFFVTGNHDYYSGDVAWTRFLEEIGLTVLRNRRVEIGDGGGRFDLAGVDDWSGARRGGTTGYDLDAALAGRDPDRAAVLLAHQPANFEVAAEHGVDLQISGHTHGGQLFPMTRMIGLNWKYHRGLYRHQDSHIYVSRGCGFWGPPARVGSPPEIVKLTLTV
jgi:hypothetical protein